MAHLTHANFHSIAVSGKCSSGKSTLCRILSHQLNWKHVDVGKEFRKISELRGLRIEQFGSIPDLLLRQIDDQIQRRIKTEVNVVWDGRLTCYLAHNLSKILKVCCVADLDVRAERFATREEISFEEATSRVLSRDTEEADVFKGLYDISDPYSRKWIDLRLDTSHSSPEDLASVVFRLFSSDQRSRGDQI